MQWIESLFVSCFTSFSKHWQDALGKKRVAKTLYVNNFSPIFFFSVLFRISDPFCTTLHVRTRVSSSSTSSLLGWLLRHCRWMQINVECDYFLSFTHKCVDIDHRSIVSSILSLSLWLGLIPNLSSRHRSRSRRKTFQFNAIISLAQRLVVANEIANITESMKMAKIDRE